MRLLIINQEMIRAGIIITGDVQMRHCGSFHRGTVSHLPAKEFIMGMFDTVRFPYRMPDGVTGADYQTKDLECECGLYEISPAGRLLRREDDGLKDIEFDGVLTLSAGDGYHLCFVQGTLAWIQVHSQGDRRWPFEPARNVTEQG